MSRPMSNVEIFYCQWILQPNPVIKGNLYERIVIDLDWFYSLIVY